MEELPTPAGDAAGSGNSLDPTLTSGNTPAAPPNGDAPLTPSAPSGELDELAPYRDPPPADTKAADEAPPPPVDEEPRFTKAEIAAMSHADRVKNGFVPNDEYQRHIDQAAQRRTNEAMERMRLQQEHEQGLTRFDTAFRGLTAEQREQLRYNDQIARAWSRDVLGSEMGALDIQRKDLEIVAWKENRAEAPTRERIAAEEIGKRLDGLRQHLLERPDWKAAAEQWEKLEAAAMEEAPTAGEGFLRFWDKFLDVRAKEIEARVRREVAAETEARIRDGVAARVEGLPEPELVMAGGHTNGTAGLQAIVNKAANPDAVLSQEEWKLYDQATAKGIYPRLNN